MEGAGEALPQPKKLSVLVEGPYFFFFFAVFFYALFIVYTFPRSGDQPLRTKN
jgi:hypothetical protein